MDNGGEPVNLWSRTAVLYKSFYFVFYAGYLPFLLYVPVYFKYLGLTTIQVGLINGIRPLMQTIGAPLWGLVGDKFRIRKAVFITAFVIMTIKTMLFLLFRPRGQTCIVTLYDKSNQVIKNSTYIIGHGITKRSYAHSITNMNTSPVTNRTPNVGQISPTKKHNTSMKTVLRESEDKKGSSMKPSGLNEITKAYGRVRVGDEEFDKNVLLNNVSSFTYETVIDHDETAQIFTGILLLIIFGETFDGAVFTLADTSCLDTLGSRNYGYYRLWGSAGWGIMTPIIGFAINHLGTTKCDVYVGAYFIIFYFYLGFMYLAILFGSHFPFENEVHNDDVDTTVKSALLNFHYGMFLFVTFYAGFCYGFLLYFVNWFIDSLGGSALVMGTATACKSIVDVVLFFLSGTVIDAVGHLNTVTISLVAYIAAFVSYSYTTNPWYAVPIEILHSGAYALVWSSSVSYLNKAAPAGSSATVQGILQGVYWGLGTGGGTIIGGYVIHTYGFVSTFRAFAIVTSVILVVFSMTQLISKCSSLDENDEKSVSSFKPDETGQSENETGQSENESTYLYTEPSPVKPESNK